MTSVLVRELIAWGLDDDCNRQGSDALDSKIRCGELAVSERGIYRVSSPVLTKKTATLRSRLQDRWPVVQKSGEFDGFKWSLAIVDLRNLIAFQRRLCFDLSSTRVSTEVSMGWEYLLDLCLPARSHNESPRVTKVSETEIQLRSGNPNFRIELCASFKHDAGDLWRFSYGSPFMEVAQYGERWFLRDGYHRAYTLLREGVVAAPAVLIEVQNLEELGSAQPWFFSEKVLFSDRPPLLIDFQNPNLVFEYERPAREKVIRISLHESHEQCQKMC